MDAWMFLFCGSLSVHMDSRDVYCDAGGVSMDVHTRSMLSIHFLNVSWWWSPPKQEARNFLEPQFQASKGWECDCQLNSKIGQSKSEAEWRNSEVWYNTNKELIKVEASWTKTGLHLYLSMCVCVCVVVVVYRCCRAMGLLNWSAQSSLPTCPKTQWTSCGGTLLPKRWPSLSCWATDGPNPGARHKVTLSSHIYLYAHSKQQKVDQSAAQLFKNYFENMNTQTDKTE